MYIEIMPPTKYYRMQSPTTFQDEDIFLIRQTIKPFGGENILLASDTGMWILYFYS